jgi:hypothetical protein
MIIRNTDEPDIEPRAEIESGPADLHRGVSNEPLLTIFAVPKPFGGTVDLIQRNAIRSWARLQPLVDVLLIGDEFGIKETADELGVRHSPDLRRNQYGTPLLSSAFETAHVESKSPILVYCNSDLILLDDFVQSMQLIAASKLAEFVAFGRRIDMSVNEEIEFENLLAINALRSRCRKQGKYSSVVCKDFFAFNRDLYRDIPDFAVGRGNWDNWMIHSAKREKRVPVINISEMATVIHQAHDYSHVGNNRLSCYVTGCEAQQNQRLAGGRNLINGSTATWRMDHQGLRKVRLNRLNLSFWSDVPRFLRLLMSFTVQR